MKKSIITIILALASVFIASAQSTNPLNYSGRMYVEAIEIIATPRYVSYEDHAILSQQMRIPSVEITKIDMASRLPAWSCPGNPMWPMSQRR